MIGSHALVNLENGETVLLQVRRHLFVFYMRILFVVLLFFAPLFFTPWIAALLGNVFSVSGPLLFTAVFLLWTLTLWLVFFLQWTDYYLDVWIITDRRVIDIEQKGVFNFEISTFRLEQIQDVTIEVRGVIATLLKFGTIHVHTAGESPNFIIHDAAHPLEVKEALMRAHGTSMATHVRRSL